MAERLERALHGAPDAEMKSRQELEEEVRAEMNPDGDYMPPGIIEAEIERRQEAEAAGEIGHGCGCEGTAGG